MSVSVFLKSFDYFFVLRPVLFVPGWSTLLAGFLITSKSRIFLSWEEILNQDWIQIAILMSILTCSMGASFLLNQMRDIETDLKNNKLFLLSEKHISKRAAIIETSLLIIISLTLAYSINYFVLLNTILFLLTTGYIYNFEPLNLKDKPWGSVFANSAMGLLAFAIGWSGLEGYNGSIWIDVLPYLLFNTALYFFTILPDVPGDRKSNKQTLAVLKGEKFVIRISFLCFIAAIVSAAIIEDYFVLLFIVFSIPFFVYAFLSNTISSTIKTTKYGIFFFALVICFKIPLYLIILIGIFIFTKWYFTKRFNYNYPNFKGE